MGIAKTFLAIGIAVVFVVFIAYAVYVIYEPPKENYSSIYNLCAKDFNCESMMNKCYPTANDSSGKLIQYVQTPYADNCSIDVQASDEFLKCIEKRDSCQEEQRKQAPMYFYERNSFYILAVIAIASIIAGVMLARYEGIGSGFMGGGVLVILWALIYTWQYYLSSLGKYIKLLGLFIVLVLLVYLGYKKFGPNKLPAKSRNR